MKSFTALTDDGLLVRVRIPDDALPSVINAGVILAEGWPVTVPGQPPALRFGDLTVTPVGTPVTRHVNRATGGDLEATDVDATYGARYLDVPGLPVLWGAKFLRADTVVRGWTFEEGEARMVEWSVALVPVKRRCGSCGGGR